MRSTTSASGTTDAGWRDQVAFAEMSGQFGLDSANTGSNDDETTLDASNVGSVVAKFDLDLSAYGTGADLGEPVSTS